MIAPFDDHLLLSMAPITLLSEVHTVVSGFSEIRIANIRTCMDGTKYRVRYTIALEQCNHNYKISTVLVS